MLSKKEFAIASNLRFISRTNFMLSLVEHEKGFIISGPDCDCYCWPEIKVIDLEVLY